MTQKINTILLVDDDQDDQLLFQEALLKTGCAVVYQQAKDGVDALEKLNSARIGMPDVVFMDVNMPRMNGIDCLSAIKSSVTLKNIPVVMYSTSCSPDYQKMCFDNGAIAYMEKPSDFFLLCNTLKIVVNDGLKAANLMCL